MMKKRKKETTLSMDNIFLKKQLMGELQEALAFKELNMELMEHLAFTADWILRYGEKNNVRHPDLDKLQNNIQYARSLMEKMARPYPSDEYLHGDKKGRNPTETGQNPLIPCVIWSNFWTCYLLPVVRFYFTIHKS
jgi:hypothetical protein